MPHPRDAFVLSLRCEGSNTPRFPSFSRSYREKGGKALITGSEGIPIDLPNANSASFLRGTSDGVTLAVRAQPGAKKTAIIGVYGEAPSAQLKIAVHAPPLEGRANQALIAFLAEFFSLSRSRVVLMSGEFSRSKVFLLRGITLVDAGQAVRGSLG